MRPLQNASNRHTGEGDCVAIGENSFKIVIPAKAGIQKLMKLLDSPVSSTGQAQSRASLARNDKIVSFMKLCKALIDCAVEEYFQNQNLVR